MNPTGGRVIPAFYSHLHFLLVYFGSILLLFFKLPFITAFCTSIIFGTTVIFKQASYIWKIPQLIKPCLWTFHIFCSFCVFILLIVNKTNYISGTKNSTDSFFKNKKKNITKPLVIQLKNKMFCVFLKISL